MRLIDADTLVEDLQHDVELDARALDSGDFVGDREFIQFDKDCKQNCIDFLRNAPTVDPVKHGRWIPCEERLPEIGGTYIVTGIQKDSHEKEWHYFVDVASSHGDYIDDYWDTFNDWIEGQETHIVAWMPLPKPYKMDEVTNDEID